jgi:hypothetical protein
MEAQIVKFAVADMTRGACVARIIEEAGDTAVVNDSEPTSPVVSGVRSARHGLRMRYLR